MRQSQTNVILKSEFSYCLTLQPSWSPSSLPHDPTKASFFTILISKIKNKTREKGEVCKHALHGPLPDTGRHHSGKPLLESFCFHTKITFPFQPSQGQPTLRYNIVCQKSLL